MLTQKQQLCKFFNSPTGCFRGDACIYKHVQVRHGLKVGKLQGYDNVIIAWM